MRALGPAHLRFAVFVGRLFLFAVFRRSRCNERWTALAVLPSRLATVLAGRPESISIRSIVRSFVRLPSVDRRYWSSEITSNAESLASMLARA